MSPSDDANVQRTDALITCAGKHVGIQRHFRCTTSGLLHQNMSGGVLIARRGEAALCVKKSAHAGSRTRVTSMGGLYDAATLRALMINRCSRMLMEPRCRLNTCKIQRDHTPPNQFGQRHGRDRPTSSLKNSRYAEHGHAGD